MNKEKTLEELSEDYLDLEDQRNENIDKLEEIDKKLKKQYSELDL